MIQKNVGNSGICSELNGTCFCFNGYYGESCELYNHCWINICLNNGICIQSLNTYSINLLFEFQTEDYFKCECNNGYNGSLCQNCKYI